MACYLITRVSGALPQSLPQRLGCEVMDEDACFCCLRYRSVDSIVAASPIVRVCQTVSACMFEEQWRHSVTDVDSALAVRIHGCARHAKLSAGDVLALLKRDQELDRAADPVETAVWSVDFGSGILFLHDHKIMHCDVKSANVLHKAVLTELAFLPERGGIPTMLQVADFGLGRRLEAGQSVLLRPSAFCGTPCCMAPEVFKGHHAVRVRILHDSVCVLIVRSQALNCARSC